MELDTSLEPANIIQHESITHFHWIKPSIKNRAKNKYEQQTLKLDFSQLKQPINTIQSLMKPANKDL